MGHSREGDGPAIEDRWGDLEEAGSGSRPLTQPSSARKTVPFGTVPFGTVPFGTVPEDIKPPSIVPAPRRHRSDRVRRDRFMANHEDRLLLSTPFDARLKQGARNVVTNGLGLVAGDDLVVVTEQCAEAIAAAVIFEASDLGLRVSAFRVDAAFCEDSVLVGRLLENIRRARGSMLISGVGLPPTFRRAVIDAGGDRRHGHMVGVSAEMMRQSARADLHAVDALGARLLEQLGATCNLEVRGAPGTALVIQCGGGLHWHNQSGMLTEAGWTNFPSGEVFTTPLSVDGTLVPDGGIWLPDGTCIGRTGKLRLHFTAGRLAHAEGLEADALLTALGGVKNARRVGQVGFGTNASVLTPVGALLQDLKMPGIHLTLGDTCAALTGADFSCDQEIPLLLRRPDVLLHDKPILVRGRYARELLLGPTFR